MERLRGYRDRDFVQTTDDYFFCVLGNVHPRDRVIAYLKYIPAPAGKWGKKNRRFERIFRHYTMADLIGTLKFLESHPEYLFDSPVLGIRMSAVPADRISVHIRPEERMALLLTMKRPDVLQKKAADLVNLISGRSGVSTEYFGVTGSLLLDIHQDFSDIDLIVYGMKNSQAVKEALLQMYKEEGSSIRRFNVEEAKKWCLDKTKKFPITYEEAVTIFKRKWGRGIFDGTMFSIHPVKLEDEVSEEYGDRTFRPEGIVTAEAIVSDTSESDLLPAVYKVEDVKILDGRCVEDIFEVVSYEGLYGGIAEEGEKIRAHGKLEKVTDKRAKREYHRILIGSKEARGRDYIKPLCSS
ncbi:hypothetical protein KEJ49_02030 [Candidatus Bathyarchaeota archaeon]|nr:hypothetical protein [Candidatus Bathyarchaeota archaeon]